ncbi:MAG: aspartate aminotransferase family protein [Gemmatimonadetes bacterium]|nr:aspartate aminotransferase family protein [Gemmatimonadota bacterium]MDA1102012.1 aspartate aminotransferase family protein [Gemmatimonadota bacterium]
MGQLSEPLGSRLPHVTVPPPGPASQALADRLRRVESRGVTHLTAHWPIFWEEAAGTNVRDADGNVYIDLTGAFGVALVGHTSRLARSAIAAQSERLIHGMGDIHPPVSKLELLERLALIAPWPDAKVILSSTGSEAVEAALKTAQVASGRPGVIAFEGGYHGLTLGALAVTERGHFRAPFERRVYGGVGFAPFPDTVRDGAEGGAVSLEAVQRLLSSGAPNGDEIGAVIVEPVQARGGARVPPAGFMAALSDIARSAGAILIADEIMTGLGRCGAVLASSRVGLVPDIVCVGKALGAGLPISACLARGAVMDAWPQTDGEAVHTSTFLGHPLACAVAADFLDVLTTSDLAQRVEEEGNDLLAALTERLSGCRGVADVRGMGLLLGIEFAEGSGRSVGAGSRVAEGALKRGLIVLPAGDDGHVLELTPPIGLTHEQVHFVVEQLAEVIEEVL